MALDQASPFSSVAAFRRAYETGLVQLLHDYFELGALILVLANASIDPLIWEHLQRLLQKRFREMDRELNKTGLGVGLDDAGDDLLVFRKLLELGLDNLELSESRRIGPWEVQYNQLRSLRPPRAASKPAAGISHPFDPDGFHFNKPYLSKEILWRGRLEGRRITLFYNKFPFVPMHAVLVPDPFECRPQLLDEQDHHYLWHLATVLESTLPGVGFGYNSYGAYASVNHLHFQMFQRRQPLAVDTQEWRHNGGSLDYPLQCRRFESVAESWEFIADLHRGQISYNCIYLPGRLYCLSRARQGSYSHSAWTGGFAWYELAGGFTTFDRTSYEALTAQDILSEFGLLAL